MSPSIPRSHSSRPGGSRSATTRHLEGGGIRGPYIRKRQNYVRGHCGVLRSAGTRGGLFRSTDGGDTWKRVNQGLRDTTVLVLTISPALDSDATLRGHIFMASVFHGIRLRSAAPGTATPRTTAILTSTVPAEPAPTLAPLPIADVLSMRRPATAPILLGSPPIQTSIAVPTGPGVWHPQLPFSSPAPICGASSCDRLLIPSICQECPYGK